MPYPFNYSDYFSMSKCLLACECNIALERYCTVNSVPTGVSRIRMILSNFTRLEHLSAFVRAISVASFFASANRGRLSE